MQLYIACYNCILYTVDNFIVYESQDKICIILLIWVFL